jgi:hypothetical protein
MHHQREMARILPQRITGSSVYYPGYCELEHSVSLSSSVGQTYAAGLSAVKILLRASRKLFALRRRDAARLHHRGKIEDAGAKAVCYNVASKGVIP